MVLKQIVQRLVVACTLLVMAGCASAPEVKRRFFWPPLPDEPKIEWLGAYRSKLDMPRTPFENFMANLVGLPDAVYLTRPLGIVSDGADRVYVSDVVTVSVIVFDFKKRDANYLGAGQKDGLALFKHPSGLAIDRENNLYVCDSADRRISVFSPDEALLRSIDISKITEQPIGVAVDNERKRLLVGDVRLQVIRVLDLAGKLLFTVGMEGGGDKDGAFLFPGMLSVMKNGNIVVADSMNARVQIFDPDGKFIRKFGRRGDSPGDFQLIKGVAVDSENHIYITDGKAHVVYIFSENGDYLLSMGGAYTADVIAAPGGFLIPQGIYIDGKDTIYVVDQMNRRFQMFQYMNERYLKEHPVETEVPTSVSVPPPK
ncbi:MAG: 6-bladed beta-propeller [Geobacter sp.]|nr:6-bladed beta-propeller [Geobacter sp.]